MFVNNFYINCNKKLADSSRFVKFYPCLSKNYGNTVQMSKKSAIRNVKEENIICVYYGIQPFVNSEPSHYSFLRIAEQIAIISTSAWPFSTVFYFLFC